MGSSRSAVREFPDAARRIMGHELWQVQQGLEPDDWRPMPGVGLGAIELRIHGGAEYRVMVVARFEEAVYVLHAFEKKSRRAPRAALTLARQRYRQLLIERSATDAHS